jgi:hypothetical protein
VDQVFVERAFVCEGQPLVCRWFNPERREYVASRAVSYHVASYPAAAK